MGMTIEEKIKTLIELHHYIRGDVHFCGYNEEDVTNALETAIDTMRKYQKIQEIVRWNNAPSPYYKPDGQLFREIEEVIEDGI